MADGENQKKKGILKASNVTVAFTTKRTIALMRVKDDLKMKSIKSIFWIWSLVLLPTQAANAADPIMIIPSTSNSETPEEITNTDLLDDLQDGFYLLNLKKADWATEGMVISGKPLPSLYDQEIEQRQQKIDATKKIPEKSIPNEKELSRRPLSECIKANSLVDNDVLDCAAGKIEKTW